MLPDPPTLLLFVGTSLILLIAPGPAILYIVAETLRTGRRGGIVASFGLATGILVHVAAATAGLSALLGASAVAFGLVKYAGAVYLVYLGATHLVRTYRGRSPGNEAVPSPAPSRAAPAAGRIFRRGLVVNILNPKIALFFLAFFPQFMPVGAGSPASSLLAMGLLFAALTLVVDVTYAVLTAATAGAVRRRLGAPRGLARRVGAYFPGFVYLGLGVAAALGPAGARGSR